MLLIVGSAVAGIGTPVGSFAIGGYTFSTYRLVLFALRRRRAGRPLHHLHEDALRRDRARDHAERRDGEGAGRAHRPHLCDQLRHRRRPRGLCGALYAPTMTLIPTMGATFVIESFVTVVVGGADVLLGTAPAAVFLAMIRMALNASYGQIIGQIGMLFAVILIIRVLPEGLSSVLVRRAR